MKPKGLLIAVVLLAVLGAAVWYSNKQEAAKAGKTDSTTTKVLSIPEDQFQEIRIQKVTGEVERLDRDGGKWKLVEPKPLPADQDAVSSVVNALTSLNADRVVEEKAEDLKSFGLADPTLRVQVKRKDGKTDELLIGDDAPTGSGTFAKLPNDPRVFLIATTTKSTLDKRPDDLRDKRLMVFDQDKLTRVELQAKGQTVEFGKDAAGEWQIVKPRPLRADSSTVNGLVDKLRDAKMDVSATEDANKGFAGGTKVAVATVQDAGGAHTLEVRKDKDKNYFAKGSSVEGAYKITADVGDALDKGLDDFRNKKLFDFGFSDPSKVEVKGASYTKSGDKWMSGAKAMDNGSVQTLIDKLRDLSATKFVAAGGGEPVFEATVTSNNGKRVEKVTIRKSGNTYFAQREGEQGIYEVDPAAAEALQKAATDVKEAAPEPAPSKK
jgi:hypothetical protein